MTTAAPWVPCGVHNHVYDIQCIRPAGHEGKHRGTYMEPKKVWWPGEVPPESPVGKP